MTAKLEFLAEVEYLRKILFCGATFRDVISWALAYVIGKTIRIAAQKQVDVSRIFANYICLNLLGSETSHNTKATTLLKPAAEIVVKTWS